MAARVAAERQEDRPGGGMQHRRAAQGATTHDPNLLGKLTGEGWVEHTTVEKE